MITQTKITQLTDWLKPQADEDLQVCFQSLYKGFNAPARYFHHRALQRAWEADLDSATETLYAMLLAWGMNRTGESGPALVTFNELRTTLQTVRDLLQGLRERKTDNLSEADWGKVKEAFGAARVMQTRSLLVAHSKLLAHLLPQCFAPIDRQYTLSYVRDSGNIPSSLEKQWDLFKDIHENFYYVLLNDETVQARIGTFVAPENEASWHTSPLKFIDNLVVAYHKASKNKKGANQRGPAQ